MIDAWDAIADVTFSKPIKEGFLNKGGDIDDLLSTAEQALDYFAAVRFPLPPLT